jgi:hypothetical protein
MDWPKEQITGKSLSNGKSMVSGFDIPVNQSIELGLQSNRSATCQVRES